MQGQRRKPLTASICAEDEIVIDQWPCLSISE
jgi:hypothetical protein